MSAFLEAKIKRAFAFNDFTDDGIVDKQDLLEHARRIAKAKGYAEDAPERADLVEQNLGAWSAMEQVAGTARLDEEGWVSLTQQMTADKRGYRKFLESSVGTTFENMDLDGDGWVTVDEFRTHLEIYGADASAAEECFARIDTNGDGKMSRSEVLDAIYEFFTSTDPDAPGNWFFGLPPSV